MAFAVAKVANDRDSRVAVLGAALAIGFVTALVRRGRHKLRRPDERG